MTALLTADEAAALHVGLNVIVRRGDEGRWAYQDEHNVWQPGASYCDPPKAWVALTGPCPTCDGEGEVLDAIGETIDKPETWVPCPDCRDRRRIVPLYTELGRNIAVNPHPGYEVEMHRLVGRAGIGVVPVVDRDSPELGDRIVYLPPYINTPPTLWLVWRGQRHGTLALDPLPTPGRDYGIVIDCVEVAP